MQAEVTEDLKRLQERVLGGAACSSTASSGAPSGPPSGPPSEAPSEAPSRPPAESGRPDIFEHADLAWLEVAHGTRVGQGTRSSH